MGIMASSSNKFCRGLVSQVKSLPVLYAIPINMVIFTHLRDAHLNTSQRLNVQYLASTAEGRRSQVSDASHSFIRRPSCQAT